MTTLDERAARSRASVRTRRVPGWVLPLLVAVLAWALSLRFPLVSPLILALVVGAVLANAPVGRRASGAAAFNRSQVTAAAFMLRAGVALLGLRLAVSDITQLGIFGIATILLTVASTFALTRYVGVRLGLEPEFASLVASGFAVCGAAAIAAVQDSVRAKEHQVGLAVALVTVHGTAMLAAIPLLGHLLGFDDRTAAIWAGASIHEVAQVAAAATLIGPGALAIAMGIKLGRVLMLAPVHHTVSRLHHGSDGSLLGEIPWFLHAFVAAVALRATGLLPTQLLTVAQHGSSIFLAAGMFGLGLGIVLKRLWPIPLRALLLSIIATTTVTGIPLLLLLVRGA